MDYSQKGNYGATLVPLPAESTATDFATDPTLALLAGYFRAFLNQYGGTAWASLSPENDVFVNHVFGHDPEHGEFNNADLPAIYMWRRRIAPIEQVAEDVRVMTSQVTLVWLPPVATQDWRRERSPIMSGFAKLLDRAIEAGRDPSYVVLGDTDTNAVAMGSFVYKLGSVFSLWLERVDMGHIEQQLDAGEFARYPALIALMTLKEMDHPDLAMPASTTPSAAAAAPSLSGYDAPYGVDLKVTDGQSSSTTPERERIIGP